ncbi:MAG: hypothetical protein M1814_001963 [Vezdaea aestivalis]|nr:MAG: hypothetical protein M1814_001963 [Vezdaea aestivalis]
MGPAPSKQQAAAEEDHQLVQRLQAMQVRLDGLERQARDSEDDDYVQVSNEKAQYYSPMSSDLSVSSVRAWEKELLQDPKNLLALSALSNGSPGSVVQKRQAITADPHLFNVRVPIEGDPITNQQSSGRCWLFATLNVFRVPLMKLHNIDRFELSQNYLFFWDKLEKSNWFLEQIIDTVDEPLDGRLVQHLLSEPVSDGGQWDMAANLVNKYGLVPHSLYPDSLAATSSGTLNSIITSKLRANALVLRNIAAAGGANVASSLAAAKAKMVREIHLIITLALGPPPGPEDEFNWEFYAADGTYQSVKSTPKKLVTELSSPKAVKLCGGGYDVNKLFSIVNDPRNEYETHLTVSRLGNVVGGDPIRYVNMDSTTLKKAAIASLKIGHPVFFGSDVGKFSASAEGVMDPDLFDYKLAFNVALPAASKAGRLRTKESSMTHAMVLTAVHLDGEGKPVRWRVENSWGEYAGEKGWFVMTDKWWDDWVYQVVVMPSAVPSKVHDVLTKKPKVLPLWDPMGALA